MFHLRASMRRLGLAVACVSLLALPVGTSAAAPHTSAHHAAGKAAIDLTSKGKPAGSGVGRKGH